MEAGCQVDQAKHRTVVLLVSKVRNWNDYINWHGFTHLQHAVLHLIFLMYRFRQRNMYRNVFFWIYSRLYWTSSAGEGTAARDRTLLFEAHHQWSHKNGVPAYVTFCRAAILVGPLTAYEISFHRYWTGAAWCMACWTAWMNWNAFKSRLRFVTRRGVCWAPSGSHWEEGVCISQWTIVKGILPQRHQIWWRIAGWPVSVCPSVERSFSIGMTSNQHVVLLQWVNERLETMFTWEKVHIRPKALFVSPGYLQKGSSKWSIRYYLRSMIAWFHRRWSGKNSLTSKSIKAWKCM